MYRKARNQGGAGGLKPPSKIRRHPGKCVGHGLKLLDIVQKIWAHLRKLSAPPSVPSWLRFCVQGLLLYCCCHKKETKNHVNYSRLKLQLSFPFGSLPANPYREPLQHTPVLVNKFIILFFL